MKTILDLKKNERGVVQKIAIDAGKEFINDIMDHGVFPGTIVTLSELNQSGDKVIFFSGETLLSIRKSEAKFIYIEEIKE